MLVKAGRLPTTPVWANLHIITAVRMLGHIRAAYAEEQRELSVQCRTLHRINLGIGNGTRRDIDRALRSLADFRGSALKSKHSAVKAIIAKARLDDACARLERAKTLEGGIRAFEISRANAVLVSLENRLGGKWRLGVVEQLFTRTLRREYHLRFERDRWLVSRLESFAANPKQMWKYEQFDRTKLEVLMQIETLLREGAPKEKVLAYVEATHPLFRVAERNAFHAEDQVTSMEHGILPKGAVKVDYLRGHYRLLWRFINNDAQEKAFAKLKQLGVFMCANKPGFVLGELSKDADPYLQGTVRLLESAVRTYDAFDMATAARQFAAALDAMKKAIGAAQQKRVG
jgi:hypothetical protein